MQGSNWPNRLKFTRLSIKGIKRYYELPTWLKFVMFTLYFMILFIYVIYTIQRW